MLGFLSQIPGRGKSRDADGQEKRLSEKKSMNKLPFKISNDRLSVAVYFRVSAKEHYTNHGPTSFTAHTSMGVTQGTVHGGGSYSYDFKRTCVVEYTNHSDKPLQLALDVKTLGKDGHLKNRDQIRLLAARKGETVSFGITSWSHIDGIHVIDVESNTYCMEIPFQAAVKQASVDGSENFSFLRTLNVLTSTLFYIMPGVVLLLFLGKLGSHAMNPKVIHPSRRGQFKAGHKLLAASYLGVILLAYILGINHFSVWIYMAGVICFGIAQDMIWSSRLKDEESYIEN